MFRVWLKVIFFCQVYQMKHRWIMTLITLLYTVLMLVLLPISRDNVGGGRHGDVEMSSKGLEGVEFRDVGSLVDSADIPDPLMISVTPDDPETRELITEAYQILERDSRNASLFNVHVTFMKSLNQMLRTLEKATWPSIGVQVHEMTPSKLEYTLHPAIVPQGRAPGFDPMLAITDDDELSRGLLQLRFAVDAAYIQKHFPNRKHLVIRSFPDSNPVGAEGPLLKVYDLLTASGLLAFSLLVMMTMLASYIIRDKLSGIRELLCVNGLPRWMVNTSWLCSFVILELFIALLQLILVILPLHNPTIGDVSRPILFILLVVYGWTALAFVSVVASALTSQIVVILLIVLYWLVSTVAFLVVLQAKKLDDQLVIQGFISMVPNLGYIMFIRVLSEFYLAETELSFGNLFTPPIKHIISAGLVLIMMILGFIILLAVSFYLDAVKPGPYGRARPWYLFTRKEKLAAVDSDDAVSIQDADRFEVVDPQEPIGLKCVNIVKIFGTNKALNRVTLDIVKNKTTVLLGHNGAGKTTLFSILCGMFSPTKGKVYTDEYSVFDGHNINRFRRVLGYCPQENLVLNELTVQEHLIIFGMLKGLTMKEAREFSDSWTRMFEMYSWRHTQAKKLSGGTKRKLCLAIAMTGNPQYLLLDEPSAGMDIESTRKMWDVLLEQKGNCTTIITTHNMDEADVLGDRIAILAHGQLKCLGSSSFLKKTLDAGYRLNCSATNKKTEDVIRSVSKSMRGAAVLYKTNHSVTFSLPSTQASNIPDLLKSLEKDFGDTVSSTLSPSSLDDVFIQVQRDVGVKINVEQLPTTAQADIRRSWCNFFDLIHRRCKWLLSKRMVTMIGMVILLPNFALVGGLYCVHGLIKASETPILEVPENVNEGPPKGTFALLSNEQNDISDILRYSLSKNGIAFEETNGGINATLINLSRRNLFKYRSKLLFAFDSGDPDKPTVYFKRRKDNAVEFAYSAVINAFLQGNATIITHRAPVGRRLEFKSKFRCPIPNYLYVAVSISFFLIVGPFFLVASTYFAVFPHEERVTLFKHLQLMTGLQPTVYWLVNLFFDLLLFVCSFAISIALLASLHHKVDLFVQPTVLSATILTLFLYGASSIMLAYVGSFFFRSVSFPILIITLGSVLIAFTVSFLVKFGNHDRPTPHPYIKYEVSFFLPWPILWNAIHKILLWSINNRNCDECNFACERHANSPTLFVDLTIEFVCFTALSIAYFLVLLFFDHGLGRKLKGSCDLFCLGKIKVKKEDVNPEVALEKQRVDSLRSKDEEDAPELVCDGLGKKFSRKKTAVYDVSFTAERGECFGLVGVNGAGKSTTFGMLASLLGPTKGTAVIEGRWKVTDVCNYNYLKRVGYCPQYEGLLKELPARTIINLFGQLGGVCRNEIGPLVDKWIEALDMNEIANRPCGQYSGGNKRKLSLAMALISNPPVVLLDEPTAGVDPVVRRKIWEILTTSLEQHERAIILTSHTMSECEAICDRLTIMVNGVMKCLGPIPVLKKTFGKSCILEVKFRANANPKQQNTVQSKILSQFAGYVTLHDIQPNRLVFLLKTENVQMYDLFATMLRIQSDNSVVDDFSLSETPLEQVFLQFAQKK